VVELKTNVLYYGDNLDILRKYIPDESIDLVYLDPPFNSQADYNVLFRETTGEPSEAQIRAFSDTWHWDLTAQRTYEDIVANGPPQVARMISALRDFVGRNDVMAYLAMMTARLIELRRVMKSSGSVYLHCDTTAGHYLKIVMDTIFGPQNFRNEITWKRTSAHNDPKRYGRIHDLLLFYGKTDRYVFNPVYSSYDAAYLRSEFRQDEQGRWYKCEDLTAPRHGPGRAYEWRGRRPSSSREWRLGLQEMERLFAEGRIKVDKDGRPLLRGHIVYLDEKRGMPAQDIWTDVLRVGNTAKERLGFPTQKPLALLERIIQASSNEGDVVLDPFCGCGTAVVAAHKLNRRWIGIDITYLAITVMKERLQDSFPGIDFEVVGEPVDLAGARALAAQDRYQFQWWALGLVNAKPVGDDRRKGADRGIDGSIGFMEAGGRARRIVVQVKSGHVNAAHIRDLKGTMEREKAEMGLFITLEPPTPPMQTEAVSAGFYHSELWNEDYPRVQICTIEDLLAGKQPSLPRWASPGFAKAEKISRPEGTQGELLP